MYNSRIGAKYTLRNFVKNKILDDHDRSPVEQEKLFKKTWENASFDLNPVLNNS